MLFNEPAETAYDLRFRIGSTPVRVHPFFWLVSLILSGALDTSPQIALMWMGVVFVSILVHEMGHVLAFRYYGISSHVVLHGFGGLAIPDSFQRWDRGGGRRRLTPLGDTFIALAGPIAGFLLAGLTIGLIYVSNRMARLPLGFNDIIIGEGPPLTYPLLPIVYLLVYVNIWWGLINLLPVYPLDGGRALGGVLTSLNPADGVRQTLIISVLTAGGIAALAVLKFHSLYLAVLFGYLAFNSFQQLSGTYGSGPRW